jgi:hypothetical protein
MSDEFIEEYNQFLAGEISAVETFEQALKGVTSADTRRVLTECKNSHALRAEKLQARVAELGGKPADSSGIWGPFAALGQSGAGSDIEVVSLLEESEAERLVQYEAQQKIVVSPVLDVLKNELLPAQHETHLKLSTLLKSMQPVAK